MPLAIDSDTWLLVLTGAGVSAESGVPTFRDANGLWENHRLEEVATPAAFDQDPALVWRFYSERRRKAKGVRPNPGHETLAAVEARIGERFLLVTQNVDGLHLRAGSRRVAELHGSLFHTRCFDCDLAPFEDEAEHAAPPPCPDCAARGRRGRLRPAVVWFGERLDSDMLRAIGRFVDEGRRHRLVFLAVGTSGAVYPAAGFVRDAREMGVQTLELNLERSEGSHWFHESRQGRAGELVPAWVAEVLE